MAFCGLCGKKTNELQLFCVCGSPLKDFLSPSMYVNRAAKASTLIVKFERSSLSTGPLSPLDVHIDNNLDFIVIENREISFNLTPGEHSFMATNVSGTKKNEIKKAFFIGYGEIVKITYKAPATYFLSPTVHIQKIG